MILVLLDRPEPAGTVGRLWTELQHLFGGGELRWRKRVCSAEALGLVEVGDPHCPVFHRPDSSVRLAPGVRLQRASDLTVPA